jgi:hypothetical protein
MHVYYSFHSTYLIRVCFQKMAEGGIERTGSESDSNLLHSSLYRRHSQASQQTMFIGNTGARHLLVMFSFATNILVPHNRRHFTRQNNLFNDLYKSIKLNFVENELKRCQYSKYNMIVLSTSERQHTGTPRYCYLQLLITSLRHIVTKTSLENNYTI